MSIEGQGHYLTLAQGRVHTKIQTRFSQQVAQRATIAHLRASKFSHRTMDEKTDAGSISYMYFQLTLSAYMPGELK